MNEIVKDEEIKDHDSYNEFNQIIYRQKMNIDDTVELSINGTPVKNYTVKYVNAHVHITIQDKGNRIESELDIIQKQIERLEAEKAELLSK